MNGRSGIKVRYDKDFEKHCYDLIKLLGINFGPADVNISRDIILFLGLRHAGLAP